jgi:beta-mannanase
MSLPTLTSTLGKSPNIVSTFVGWPDSFPTNFAATCTNNQTLLVFWENYGFSLDAINAGSNDAYIRSFAQSIANNRCPVILSLFHEMNGNWDSWDGTVGTNSPAKLIAAWKHIHDIFVAASVTNVTFAWVMNDSSVPDVPGNQFSDYYPGDTYVDYVGVDGFNFGTPWQTFGQVFDSAMSKIQAFQKPIYLFSLGSAAGTQKAAWITEGLGTHVKTYTNVKGWVYFNENASGSNWLIDSDQNSLAAFKTILP